MAADTEFPQKIGASVMGINVFTTPRERLDELIVTLGAIADLADSHALPRNMHSSFHRAIEAPIVVNYVQYKEREGALELANYLVKKRYIDLLGTDMHHEGHLHLLQGSSTIHQSVAKLLDTGLIRNASLLT